MSPKHRHGFLWAQGSLGGFSPSAQSLGTCTGSIQPQPGSPGSPQKVKQAQYSGTSALARACACALSVTADKVNDLILPLPWPAEQHCSLLSVLSIFFPSVAAKQEGVKASFGAVALCWQAG